jgi:hypothetical protein
MKHAKLSADGVNAANFTKIPANRSKIRQAAAKAQLMLAARVTEHPKTEAAGTKACCNECRLLMGWSCRVPAPPVRNLASGSKDKEHAMTQNLNRAKASPR